MELGTPGCSLPRGRWDLSSSAASPSPRHWEPLAKPCSGKVTPLPWAVGDFGGCERSDAVLGIPSPAHRPVPPARATRSTGWAMQPAPGLVARPGQAPKAVTVGPANKTQSPDLPRAGVDEGCAGWVAPRATVGVCGHGHQCVWAPLCTHVWVWVWAGVSVCNKAWVPLWVPVRVCTATSHDPAAWREGWVHMRSPGLRGFGTLVPRDSTGRGGAGTAPALFVRSRPVPILWHQERGVQRALSPMGGGWSTPQGLVWAINCAHCPL